MPNNLASSADAERRSLECYGTANMDAFVQEVEASITFKTGGPSRALAVTLSC